jgi:transcriptional regulator with XRE-family HTH domain
MIRKNVEKIRKAKGVSMTHLASKLDLTLQGYRHIATGSVRLDAERLKVIGLVLNVDPGIFFDDNLTDSVIKTIEDKINYLTQTS